MKVQSKHVSRSIREGREEGAGRATEFAIRDVRRSSTSSPSNLKLLNRTNTVRVGGPGIVADAWKVRKLTLTVRLKNGTRASTKPDKTVYTHPKGWAYFEGTAIPSKSEAPAIVLQFAESANDSPQLEAKSCSHCPATARDLTSGRRTEE